MMTRTYCRAFDAPPDFLSPGGVMAIWFTRPDGVVLQFVKGARGTADVVHFLMGEPLQALHRRYPRGEPLIAVVDLSLMEGRDAEARAAFLELCKSFGSRITTSIVVPPLVAPPLYMTTLKTTASLLKIFGIHVEIVPSMKGAREAYRLEPVAPG